MKLLKKNIYIWIIDDESYKYLNNIKNQNNIYIIIFSLEFFI